MLAHQRQRVQPAPAARGSRPAALGWATAPEVAARSPPAAVRPAAATTRRAARAPAVRGQPPEPGGGSSGPWSRRVGRPHGGRTPAGPLQRALGQHRPAGRLARRRPAPARPAWPLGAGALARRAASARSAVGRCRSQARHLDRPAAAAALAPSANTSATTLFSLRVPPVSSSQASRLGRRAQRPPSLPTGPDRSSVSQRGRRARPARRAIGAHTGRDSRALLAARPRMRTVSPAAARRASRPRVGRRRCVAGKCSIAWPAHPAAARPWDGARPAATANNRSIWIRGRPPATGGAHRRRRPAVAWSHSECRGPRPDARAAQARLAGRPAAGILQHRDQVARRPFGRRAHRHLRRRAASVSAGPAAHNARGWAVTSGRKKAPVGAPQPAAAQ